MNKNIVTREELMKPYGKYADKTNIYVIQCILDGADGPIKIGRCKGSVEKRMEKLQIGCPFELTILRIYTKIDSGMENQFHKLCKKYRLRGEWFDFKAFEMLPTDFRGWKPIL